MKDIKTKDKKVDYIKVLDKDLILAEKLKDNLVGIKEKSDDDYSNNIEYGNEKIIKLTGQTTNTILIKNKDIGKKSIERAKIKFENIKVKINTPRKKPIFKTNKVKNIGLLKAKNDNIKRSQQKKIVLEKVSKGIKDSIKATLKAIKEILAGAKLLIYLLIGGGSIALSVIVIICLVGLLLASIFGIFFSGSKTSSDSMSMNEAISEINIEMATKINAILAENNYDDYTITSDRAEWKDILAIYTAKISNGTNEQEVLTLDKNKVETLKQIFWDFNTIDYEVKTELFYDEKKYEQASKKILYIRITHKTLEEMQQKYRFTILQKKQVSELMDSKYSKLWTSAIYGSSGGGSNMVQIALAEIGNKGGEKYWRWYGFNSRVEWCAIFVSWVANQAGYIDAKIIPKFSGCQNGIDWFKAMGQWQTANYTPRPGDIIFFDWEHDGKVNHVGIVEKVENNKIYTIEGNSTNDTCLQKNYNLNSKSIFGYGVPIY